MLFQQSKYCWQYIFCEYHCLSSNKREMSRKSFHDRSTVNDENNPEIVSPPLEYPVPIYGQRAGYTALPLLYTNMSDDWRLVLSCLAFLWSCTLVGLFAARFPLAGRIICWMVLSAISTTLVWKLIHYWRARRRNQNYVSVWHYYI